MSELRKRFKLPKEKPNEEEVINRSNFSFSERDWSIIEAAKLMLWKMVRAPQVKPKELVGISKALCVLEHLPKVIGGIDVNVTIVSPKVPDGAFRYWTVEIADLELYIYSGGSHYSKDVGSDSFTSFSWWVKPGHGAIYDDHLYGEPDAFFFEIQSLDFVTESYGFAVEDNLEQFDMGEKSDEAN